MAKQPNLRPCVDCNKSLSPTATNCGSCNSTDPFGVRRAEEKFKAVLVMAAIAVVLALFGAYKWKGITPMDMARGEFHKLWQ